MVEETPADPANQRRTTRGGGTMGVGPGCGGDPADLADGGMVLVVSRPQFPQPRRPEPVLITEAAPSMAEQHRHRKKRYTITMAVRSVCLILAAVSYHVVWLMAIFVALMVLLPGIAVIMANDGPPKKRVTIQRPPPPADRVLEGPRPAHVIDG